MFLMLLAAALARAGDDPRQPDPRQPDPPAPRGLQHVADAGVLQARRSLRTWSVVAGLGAGVTVIAAMAKDDGVRSLGVLVAGSGLIATWPAMSNLGVPVRPAPGTAALACGLGVLAANGSQGPAVEAWRLGTTACIVAGTAGQIVVNHTSLRHADVVVLPAPNGILVAAHFN